MMRVRRDLVEHEASARATTPDLGAHGRVVIDFERDHGQILFGFLRRLGVTDSAAEDLVQEALLRLFNALNAGQQVRDLKAWTFHVAYRLAMDEHRRVARHLRVVRVRAALANGSDPADNLDRQHVWDEVDRLTERQRVVLYLRFRADLAFEDVAMTMGITASAARSHCTQALSVLRARLAQEGR